MAISLEEKERQYRIDYEILVDCYDSYEQASAWYCYAEDHFNSPFTSSYDGVEVQVTSLASEEQCEEELMVNILVEGDEIPVLMNAIEPIDADEETTQLLADWKYWLEQGYSFAPDYEDQEEDY
jgi:hypothetical protein